MKKSSPKPKRKSGTRPDTSLHLGQERRDWLKKNGGIQPIIMKLIDREMGR